MNDQKLKATLLAKQSDLIKINERLTNPMASQESILGLRENKKALEEEIERLELDLEAMQPKVKPFIKSLNESPEL